MTFYQQKGVHLFGKNPFVPLYVVMVDGPEESFTIHDRDEAYGIKQTYLENGRNSIVVETAE